MEKRPFRLEAAGLSVKVLIFGAGAVGSVFGGFLSREHEVTLLGRKAHLDVIRKKGLRISGIWGKFHFKRFAGFETDTKALVRKKQGFDLILLTVKSYDTPEAAKLVSRILRARGESVVLSLQNGLGNIEALERFIPKKKILAGRVIFGAAVPHPGNVKITVMAEPTAIGEAFQRKVTPRVKKIVALCDKAGVPCVATPDVRARLWAKVIYNCALNPLASVLGCHYGKLTESEETRAVMDEVICEIYGVAKEAGVHLDPETPGQYAKLFYSRLVPRTYDHRPSMLQDLEKGRRTEIDALSGAIVQLGKKYGVKTPVNQKLAELVKEREAHG